MTFEPGAPRARAELLAYDDVEDQVIFERMDVGDYRIWGGSIEAPNGDGYLGAVVVDQALNDHPTRREVFRYDGLSDGKRWPEPEAALRYAIRRGLDIVMQVQLPTGPVRSMAIAARGQASDSRSQ
jgi:hypothetical protein